jgi:co-chaperonin GroES (HSP10)
MDFEQEVTTAGIVIPSQNGKLEGIKARWGQVYAVGPDQTEVSAGDWVYIEHGRWTRGVEIVSEYNTSTIVRRVDTDAIMLCSSSKPADVYVP